MLSLLVRCVLWIFAMSVVLIGILRVVHNPTEPNEPENEHNSSITPHVYDFSERQKIEVL